ncbi:MAG: 50S ribosomal protein L18 [Candidatus Omnitrophica bacterium]|nr:50S ribosomal protein L18 [Candidatus Omnitrophota bacterium]
MGKTNKKEAGRKSRHRRVRKKVSGTDQRPRLSVHRSSKNIYLQLTDDINNKTLIGVSSLNQQVKEQLESKNGGNVKAAVLTGQVLGKKAAAKGISQVVFDKGGYKYHGRVKAVADAVRKEGLKL